MLMIACCHEKKIHVFLQEYNFLIFFGGDIYQKKLLQFSFNVLNGYCFVVAREYYTLYIVTLHTLCNLDTPLLTPFTKEWCRLTRRWCAPFKYWNLPRRKPSINTADPNDPSHHPGDHLNRLLARRSDPFIILMVVFIRS